MTKPVALIHYQNLLTGNQVLNRLRDLGYQAQAVSELAQLGDQAAAHKPMVAVVCLDREEPQLPTAIKSLKANPATSHVPVLVLVKHGEARLAAQARTAGAKLVADDGGTLGQLPQLLDQVLELE